MGHPTRRQAADGAALQHWEEAGEEANEVGAVR